MDSPKNVRVETDTFGPIEVEAHRYWGAQTQRSLQNFKIGGERMPPAAGPRARDRQAGGGPGQRAARASSTASSPRPSADAAQEVVDGKLTDEFPLVVWQTGSGTQTNMNANEVIASRANELLGGERGGKSPVHPNDHVNRGQSSNDTFPTAMHVAAAEQAVRELLPALEHLHAALAQEAARSSRTSSRSAAPISRTRRRLTLGQEFSAYATQIAYGIERVKAALPRVYQLAQGGTAVGTGLNAKKGFAEAFAGRGRRDHRPAVRDRAQQVRGAGRATTRWSSCTARSTCWPPA